LTKLLIKSMVLTTELKKDKPPEMNKMLDGPLLMPNTPKVSTLALKLLTSSKTSNKVDLTSNLKEESATPPRFLWK